MNNLRCIAAITLILLLTACDNSSTSYHYADGVLTARTPKNLRAVTNETLVAEVSINDTVNTYFGSDYPDDQWLIVLDVEADRTYDIEIHWLTNELLLMEERGTFYTDSQNPVITPDTEIATAGGDRFDADCDGTSNLEEINMGTNPGSASQIPCHETPVLEDPTIQLRPWLAYNFLTYAFSEVPQPVVSIRHQLKIRQTPINNAAFYGIIVTSVESYDQTNGTQTQARATLQLVENPSGDDSVQFFATQAIGAVPVSTDGSCTEVSDSPGYFCILPMVISANRWYELSIIEVAPSHWQGRVTDVESGDTYPVANIEMPAGSSWRAQTVDLGLKELITAESCTNSLDRISLQFKNALINDQFDVTVSNTVVSPCVESTVQATGSGWTSGNKDISGEIQHFLSIGDS